MKNLLEFLLIHLCHHPEDVLVEEVVGERETQYILHVNSEDMGRIIGKNGSIIQAIRSIAKVRAIKEGIHANIILAEETPRVEAKTELAPAEETEAEVEA